MFERAEQSSNQRLALEDNTMIGRPLRIEWSAEDTPEALKAAYQAERDIGLRTRVHGLWLVRSGWQIAESARAVGVGQRTVQTWVGCYRDGGAEGARSHKMGGQGQAPLSEQRTGT